tara:strand:- start:276 stop:1598 length:1323 start_codon:yes stop_codon:yes gene_type:complete
MRKKDQNPGRAMVNSTLRWLLSGMYLVGGAVATSMKTTSRSGDECPVADGPFDFIDGVLHVNTEEAIRVNPDYGFESEEGIDFYFEGGFSTSLKVPFAGGYKYCKAADPTTVIHDKIARTAAEYIASNYPNSKDGLPEYLSLPPVEIQPTVTWFGDQPFITIGSCRKEIAAKNVHSLIKEQLKQEGYRGLFGELSALGEDKLSQISEDFKETFHLNQKFRIAMKIFGITDITSTRNVFKARLDKDVFFLPDVDYCSRPGLPYDCTSEEHLDFAKDLMKSDYYRKVMKAKYTIYQILGDSKLAEIFYSGFHRLDQWQDQGFPYDYDMIPFSDGKQTREISSVIHSMDNGFSVELGDVFGPNYNIIEAKSARKFEPVTLKLFPTTAAAASDVKRIDAVMKKLEQDLQESYQIDKKPGSDLSGPSVAKSLQAEKNEKGADIYQ